MKFVEKFRPKLHVKNRLLRGAIGEFFGTFLLVFIGECIVAQYHLGPTGQKLNSWIQINLGWGFAVTFCVFLMGKTSGGHLNPAVSAMFFSFGLIDATTTVVYIAAQTVGAFFGAAGTFIFYYEKICQHESVSGASSCPHTVTLPSSTAVIFTTFAPDDISALTVFIDQAVGTGVLCFFIAAIIDKKNGLPAYLHALLVGFVVMMIGCAFGLHIGYPINPARDFGPRLFALTVYGQEVLTHPYECYFLLPIFGPFVGGVAGGWLYYLVSGYHIPDVCEFEHNRQNSADHGCEESSPLNPLNAI